MKEVTMEKRVSVTEWSAIIRVLHWVMAITIFVLIGTGFYLARPFMTISGETTDKFLMNNIRLVHVLFGLFLTFTFFWRVYVGFFPKYHEGWKQFLAFTDWKNLLKQVKFYTLLSTEKPEHTYLYGPLQSIAYGGIFLLIFFIVLTGLILMGANYDTGITGLIYVILRPFETMMGGLVTVRYIHHILNWLFVLFIFIHIYMAFWYDVVYKEGTVSSIINGRVFRKIEE